MCVCGCVCPVLPPLQLLPQAFAVNKNVFSVSLPGYIRAKESFGVKKNVHLSSVQSDEMLFYTEDAKRYVINTTGIRPVPHLVLILKSIAEM